jgi:hypothetical protein
MRRVFFELEHGEIGGKSLGAIARESAARVADEVVVTVKPLPSSRGATAVANAKREPVERG